MASALDRLLLARELFIDEWLASSPAEICKTAHSPVLEGICRMTYEDIALVMTVRELANPPSEHKDASCNALESENIWPVTLGLECTPISRGQRNGNGGGGTQGRVPSTYPLTQCGTSMQVRSLARHDHPFADCLSIMHRGYIRRTRRDIGFRIHFYDAFTQPSLVQPKPHLVLRQYHLRTARPMVPQVVQPHKQRPHHPISFAGRTATRRWSPRGWRRKSLQMQDYASSKMMMRSGDAGMWTNATT